MKKQHQIWMDTYLANCRVSNRSIHTIINYRSDLLKFIAWYESYHSELLNRANAQVISDYKNYLSEGLKAATPATLQKNPFSRVKGLFRKFFINRSSQGPLNFPPANQRQFIGLSVSSRRRHLSAIKNFYDYLKQANEDSNKLFENNPVKPKLHGIKLKDEDVEHTELLTKEDWQSIVDYVYTPRDRFLVHLMYYAGMRLSEVCQLKIKDFDSKNRSINFVRKGGYVHKLFPQQSEVLFELYELYLRTRKHTSDYVFLNNKGTSITPRGMYNAITKIFRKAICPTPNLTPHSFRKACATNLYEKTKDLLFVRDYLNHSDAKVTQTYIEVTEESQKELGGNRR